MRRPLAIRTRLTLWYGVVLATTIVALGILVWLSSAAIMRGSLREALQVQAADVRAGLDRATTVAVTRLDPAQPGMFTAIFGAKGELKQHSAGIPIGLRLPLSGPSTAQLSSGGSSFELLAEPAPDGQTIVVGSSLAQVDRILGNLALLLVGIGAAGFLASLAGGWLLSGRALGPVERLTTEATVIGAADLERRLPQPARLDEIGRLARTLNVMLDRVAESVRRERAFISAASHDLRTPIAALRTELELAERTPDDHDGLLAAVRLAHADAVRLSNLAADLLGLAEAEATGRAIVRQPVGVNQLIEGAVTRVQPLAAERSTQVQFLGSGAIVSVDRVRLEQALVNLLSNAIREGPVGSLVEVVAEVRRAEPARLRPGGADGRTEDGSSQDPSQGTLDITVLDRGPGVAPEVRPVLFVPFAARARGRSEGTGLGLATAAAAVHAHGGEIVYAGRPGGGAAFRLRVPTVVIAEDPGLRTGTPPIRRSWQSPSAAKPFRRAVSPRRGRSRPAIPSSR
jgi:signal transduction histidine kinase